MPPSAGRPQLSGLTLANEHRSVGTRLVGLRWLCLVVVGAYVASVTWATSGDVGADAMAVLCFVAAALLLTALRTMTWRNLWAWVILVVFMLGYFAKALWVSAHVAAGGPLIGVSPELAARLRIDEIINGYGWTTLAFATFCVVTIGLLRLQGSSNATRVDPDERASPTRTLGLVWLLFGAYLVASALSYTLGVGQLGRVSASGLLGTFLGRFRDDLFPGALLLCLWIFDRQSRTKGVVLVVGILITATIIETFVTTSRGSATMFLGPVFLLWTIGQRLNAQRVLLLLAAVVGVVVAHPLTSQLRLTRLDVAADYVPGTSLADTIAVPFLRISGVDGIWQCLGAVPSGVAVDRAVEFVRDGSDGPFYNHQVVGLFIVGDTRAPGLVGAFMLLGGEGTVVALTSLYLIAVCFLWRWIAHTRIAPVGFALASITLLTFTSEGTFYVANVLATILVLLVCATLYSRVLRSPVRRGSTGLLGSGASCQATTSLAPRTADAVFRRRS